MNILLYVDSTIRLCLVDICLFLVTPASERSLGRGEVGPDHAKFADDMGTEVADSWRAMKWSRSIENVR